MSKIKDALMENAEGRRNVFSDVRDHQERMRMKGKQVDEKNIKNNKKGNGKTRK